ncbi:DUF4236 domain-containing protein [Thermaerobacter sp. PB12/4term]|uniref:DUF4236 domain-containing protein n=1 Tax=Thermaerobacter sp. PB12/4term TaxID=2293838 RepID=UPI000E32A0A3|nr:DUF4236 domain-containing protein [Thermaerobacter sp. PB12/4term]QIA26552.1 DUF4236 domain-containing protein [Thermaerobacter sp. PB12/4term]
MGWYLRKSFRLAPGVRLNLSRSGLGLSVGTRGARIGVGPRGAYLHAGTGGIYYRKTLVPPARRRGRRHREEEQAAPATAVRSFPDGRLDGGPAAGALGCLGLVLLLVATGVPWLWPLALGTLAAALFLSWRDRQLVRTWQQAAAACQAGRWEEGRRLLEPLLSRHPEEADLWLLWGLSLWQAGQEAEAAGALLRIDTCPDTLGRLAGRTRTAWEVEFRPWPLRVELPSAPGVDLLQAYLLAHTGRHGEAVAQLEGALALNPGYHAARLLKALILVEGHRGRGAAGSGSAGSSPGAGASDTLHQAVALLQDIPRDDALYLWAVAIMGQAFREAGHPDLAVATLRTATRFRRDPEALKAIRYQLALAYRDLGDLRRAREQLARIVTEDIGYRDARQLLEQWGGPAGGGRDPRAGGGGQGGRPAPARVPGRQVPGAGQDEPASRGS